MVTTFDDLLNEIQRGKAVLLSNSLVGDSGVRRIIVQRESGALWQAEDWYAAHEAFEWSLNAMEFALFHPAVFDTVPLDCERLWRHINFLHAADERFALETRGADAVDTALKLMRQARAS